MPYNNQRGERVYTKEYLRVLRSIFRAQNAWGKALQPLQILDGVRNNATAFTVKTNNTPVVIGEYDTSDDVAFGEGTGKSSRFGKRTEIIYEDTDVPYDYLLAIHEGLDDFTVNEEMDFAVSERLEVQSQAQTRKANTRIGAFIGAKAGNEVGVTEINQETVMAVFAAMKAFYVNKEVIVPVTAFVAPTVHNILIEADLVTEAKGSGVDIDRGSLQKSYGFWLEETPDKYFAAGAAAYFVPDEILLPFIGINTARAISSEDFVGVALQAAAKGGTYVSDENASVTSVFKKSA